MHGSNTMKSIDDLVGAYRARKQESKFFEKCEATGIDYATMQEDKTLWAEYGALTDKRPFRRYDRFVAFWSGLGALVYDASHPLRTRKDVEANADLRIAQLERCRQEGGYVHADDYLERPNQMMWTFPDK